MHNPLAVAFKGKGFFPTLSRAGTILRRYGLSSTKMEQALEVFLNILQEYDCRATFPVTATALAHNADMAKKVQSRGIELAGHGYEHVDYTLLSLDEQKSHMGLASRNF